MSHQNAVLSSMALFTLLCPLGAYAGSSSGSVDLPRELPQNSASTSTYQSTAQDSDSSSAPHTGFVGLESSSFLYQAKDRGNSSTTFEGEWNGSFHGNSFQGKANAQIYSFVGDHPEIGFESKELYISTTPKLMSNLGEISIGRRYVEWSKVDKAWDMMSLWSPRWTWDPLHPETIGMTGIFYTYDRGGFHFTAFGSPLAIPERGTSTFEKDGNIVSNSPLWNQLPDEMNVMGVQTKIHYSLMTPPMNEILFRPNFALKALYQFDSGAWLSAGLGVLPVHIIQMAAEPYLDSSTTGDLNVNVRPQFPLRNIYTAEAGYQPGKDWNVWFSTSYEQPFQFENESTWLNPIITPTSIVSAGTSVQVTSNFRFIGSALFIHEQPFVSSSTLKGVDVELPTRFPVKQGFKIGGNWRFDDQTQSRFSWTQDLIEQNHFVSLDVQHALRKASLIIGGGADLFFNNTTHGWVGQYYGDDRLRGWLKYVF